MKLKETDLNILRSFRNRGKPSSESPVIRKKYIVVIIHKGLLREKRITQSFRGCGKSVLLLSDISTAKSPTIELWKVWLPWVESES